MYLESRRYKVIFTFLYQLYIYWIIFNRLMQDNLSFKNHKGDKLFLVFEGKFVSERSEGDNKSVRLVTYSFPLVVY